MELQLYLGHDKDLVLANLLDLDHIPLGYHIQ